MRKLLVGLALLLFVPLAAAQSRRVGGVCTAGATNNNPDLGTANPIGGYPSVGHLPFLDPYDLLGIFPCDFLVTSPTCTVDFNSPGWFDDTNTVSQFRGGEVYWGRQWSDFPPATPYPGPVLTGSALSIDPTAIGAWKDNVYTDYPNTNNVQTMGCWDIYRSDGGVKSVVRSILANKLEVKCTNQAKVFGYTGSPTSKTIGGLQFTTDGTMPTVTGSPVSVAIDSNKEVKVVPNTLWSAIGNADSYSLDVISGPQFYYNNRLPPLAPVYSDWMAFPDTNASSCGPLTAMSATDISKSLAGARRFVATSSADVAQTIFANDGAGNDACTKLGLYKGQSVTIQVGVTACRCGVYNWAGADQPINLTIRDSGNYCPQLETLRFEVTLPTGALADSNYEVYVFNTGNTPVPAANDWDWTSDADGGPDMASYIPLADGTATFTAGVAEFVGALGDYWYFIVDTDVSSDYATHGYVTTPEAVTVPAGTLVTVTIPQASPSWTAGIQSAYTPNCAAEFTAQMLVTDVTAPIVPSDLLSNVGPADSVEAWRLSTGPGAWTQSSTMACADIGDHAVRVLRWSGNSLHGSFCNTLLKVRDDGGFCP